MPNELARARRTRVKVTFRRMFTNEDVHAGKVQHASKKQKKESCDCEGQMRLPVLDLSAFAFAAY